jgi:hypothetical protein
MGSQAPPLRAGEEIFVDQGRESGRRETTDQEMGESGSIRPKEPPNLIKGLRSARVLFQLAIEGGLADAEQLCCQLLVPA